MKICSKAIVSIVIFILPVYLNAQVTIGMGSAPSKTALLQLKDRDPDDLYADNETSRSGGLLLPRTRLVDKSTLEPYVEISDPDYEQYKKESIGLLVYNIATTPDLNPGIYHWDGAKWTSISGTTPENPIINPDPEINDVDDPEALKLPNSYIIPRLTTLEFPITKGYAVWKNKLEEALSNTVKPTVELIWQTKPDLVKSVSLIENDDPALSRIRVEVTDINGNALVAMKINNEIKWSWHIWITNYNPEEPEGQRYSGNYTFMDRNLGSLRLSRDRRDILTFGMLYQWGRKDPFPGSDHLEEEEEDRSLFLIDNQSTDIQKRMMPNTSTNNIAASCMNPNVFYNSNTGDWYSMNTSTYDHFLWSTKGAKKEVYDPCPRGWRIPVSDAWDPLPDNTTEHVTEKEGLDWSKPESGCNGGHYPYSGYRRPDSGEHTMKENKNGTDYLVGYVWSDHTRTDTGNHGTAYPLYFYRWGISKPTAYAPKPKAQGNAVRCMKETDETKRNDFIL